MDTSVIEFINDDAGYMQWLRSHPQGYVLNAWPPKNPSSFALHRPWCKHVGDYTNTNGPGAFTARGYIKVCATDIEGLREWVRRHGHEDGSFSSEGCYCVRYGPSRSR